MALMNCGECTNEVSDKAISCPRCGAPVAFQVAPEKTEPTIGDSRAAFTQAKINTNLAGSFFWQIVLVSGIAGWIKESWLVFGVVFLGLFVLYMIPVIGKLVAILIATAWGAVGYHAGIALGSQNAGYVLAGFLFLMSFGASVAGSDLMKDMSTTK